MNLEIGYSLPDTRRYCVLSEHYRTYSTAAGFNQNFVAAAGKQTMVGSKAREEYLLLAWRDLISP